MLLLEWRELEPFFHALGYDPGLEQRAIHEALLGCCTSPDGPLPATVILAGGEQGGKSYVGGYHVAVAAASTPKGIFWVAGRRYEDAKREWEYARDALLLAGLTRKGMYTAGETGPWVLRLTNGSVIKTIATEDVTVIAREAPDGVVMCEPGRQSLESFKYLWRRCIPRTAWFLVAGTFEGAEGRWLSDLWRECQSDNAYAARSLSLPSYANPVMYPLGARDPKFLAACAAIRQANPTEAEEEIGERFLGIPRQPKGLVFSEFRRQLHVRNVDFEPQREVILAVDPGYFPSAYAVEFCQIAGGQVRVCDELYVRNTVNRDVITLVKNHPVFSAITHIVIDVAANAHAGAQDSAYETWMAEMAGRGVTISGRRVDIATRNARIHDKLRVSPLTQEPYLVINPRCRNTIAEFEEGYRLRERDNGMIGSDKPIDRDNHAIAALGYLIVDRYDVTDLRRDPIPSSRRRMAYDVAYARQPMSQKRPRFPAFSGLGLEEQRR